MSKEGYLTIGFTFLTLIIGFIQWIHPVMPPIIGWPIVVLLTIAAIIAFILAIKKRDEVDKKQSKELYSDKWESYEKIVDLCKQLDKVHGDERMTIRKEILREGGHLNRPIQKMIDIFLPAEAECEELGMSKEINTEKLISDISKIMHRKYKR